MGIFERPAGSGVWWILYYANGKRHREKVGGKRQALAAYQQRKTETRQGKFDINQVQAHRTRLTVSNLMERYWDRWESSKSRSSAAGHRANLTRSVGDRVASALTLTELEGLRRRMLQVLKPASVNRELGFLRTVLQLAVRDGLLQSNPTDGLRPLKLDNGRIRWLSTDEEAALLEQLDQRDQDIVTVAIHTGLRRGELFALRPTDVDLAHGWLTVQQSKSGLSRRIPLTDTARQILSGCVAGQYCWPSRSGGIMDGQNWYNRRFALAAKRAGLIGLHCHDLRHTFCSRLAMRGVPLNTIRELAGHADMAMTLRYAHLSPDHQAQAIRVLDT